MKKNFEIERLQHLSTMISLCYNAQTFSEDNFYFYENRTNFKDKFRTGIFKPSEDKTNLPSEQL
ncbi:MAG: hypothetical protein LBD88_02555, partial [Candidatus Peribacteria bacterium]|nr:hypothetical protein [Candidatus Peribacteria bacterium]